MPATPKFALHHIALTVTSFDVSIPWYEGVFGISYQMEAPHEGGVGKLLADADWSLVIVLHEHEGNQHEPFHETRTGLDHVGIAIDSEPELLAFQAHLRDVGGVEPVERADRALTQSAIADTLYGLILVFRDPDNIQLEAFAPPRAATT